MAGIPLPKQGIQGRSMTGIVAGKDSGWDQRAFAERGRSMIRTKQYKLIKNGAKELRKNQSSGEYELYDLIKDPLETNDLAADPRHASTLKDLIAQHQAWQKDIPPVPVIAGVAPEPKPGTPFIEKKAAKKREPAKAEMT